MTEFQFHEEIARLLKHGYYASVSYVDACFGRLIDGLKKLGLYDNHVDPQENVNIAMIPENGQIIKDLSDKLTAGWRAALMK